MILQSAASDLSLLEAAARAAGDLTRTLMRQPLEVLSKGAAGPVTNIDFAVNDLLTEKLRTARPDYGWLSEETPDDPAQRMNYARVFMLDPIDGTAALVAGIPEFTISIGIVEHDRAWAGAVYNPMTDAMYVGALGSGTRLNGKVTHANTRDTLEGARMVGRRKFFADKRWPIPWPQMDVTAKQSIAYRMALVAAGMADGALMLGPKYEWDIAAGAALVQAAGGRVTDPWGAPLLFNQLDPRAPGAVASGAALHPLLIERTNFMSDTRQG